VTTVTDSLESTDFPPLRHYLAWCVGATPVKSLSDNAIVKVIRCEKGHKSFWVSMGNPEPEFNAYTTECPHDASGSYPIGRVPVCGENIVEWEMAKAKGGDVMSEKTSIQTLDGVAAGRYVVTTHSGTRHYVDLDAKMATRNGAPGHEWGDRFLHINPYAALAGSTPKFAAHYEPITPDGEPFRFDTIQDCHGWRTDAPRQCR
jgi:hypothetical protein